MGVHIVAYAINWFLWDWLGVAVVGTTIWDPGEQTEVGTKEDTRLHSEESHQIHQSATLSDWRNWAGKASKGQKCRQAEWEAERGRIFLNYPSEVFSGWRAEINASQNGPDASRVLQHWSLLFPTNVYLWHDYAVIPFWAVQFFLQWAVCFLVFPLLEFCITFPWSKRWRNANLDREFSQTP